MELLQDINMGPPSPSKGKGVDASHKTWRAGWWDFYPLLERPKRPLQWSQSSVIFTAHPSQALITGRHFSSSKQFVLPSPTPVITSPGSYDSPSVLSVSPGDLWLFAYFPRRDGEGVGCLWKRGAQIDDWLVNECWTYPRCGGAVTASWMGGHREWVADGQGNPMRLPLRGPPTPISDPNLLVVTEDNWLHLTYVRYYHPGVRFIKRHLSFTGLSIEMAPTIDIGDNANNTRRCIDAAIGIGYNEMTIFVALHSSRVPPPARQATTTPSFNSMDLSVPVGLVSLNPPDQKVMEWETWGDERTIELFEVNLRFDGVNMALYSTLISSQECTVPLINMAFACAPPPLSSAQADSSSTPKRNPGEKGKMFLITASTNLHDYIEPPTSSLTSYSIIHKLSLNGPRNHFWSLQKESTHTIETGVVSHIQPFLDLSNPNMISMYICVLDTSGPIPVGQKEATIGTTKVLVLPDFSDNSNWETSPMKCPVNSLGKDLPLLSTFSPNGTLLCTLPFSVSNFQITIQPLPKRNLSNTSRPAMSYALAVAILGRVATSDLVHSICSPHLPRNEATNIIYHTLDILDKHHKSQIPYPSTWDVVGIATEVYRGRSLYAKEEKESEILKELWQTAHDICSLAACNIAFEDCKEKDGYDLDCVWQIISICTWVVSFTERLMKSCVLSNNSFIVDTTGADTSKATDFDAMHLPILLHLSHPFALQNFITALKHVTAFRTFLGSLPAGGEHAKVAQVVLIDAVDCSGVNFGDLLLLLEDNFESAQKPEPQELRKALAACQPTPVMRPRLRHLLQKISQSETILNKSTLFIKPFDLVDGVARMGIVNQRKNDERDVITKSLLDEQGFKGLCLRCGGRTSTGSKESPPTRQSNPKWSVWELMWQLRCICGGSWLTVVRS